MLGLPTAARAATASTDIRAYPRSRISAIAASRIAASTRAERGRPARRLPARGGDPISFLDRFVSEAIPGTQ